MKKSILYKCSLVLLAAFCSFVHVQAQVYNGDLNLITQADVNAFSYTRVNGEVDIHGDDITDLSPLITLISVGEMHIYNNPNLENLDGLSNMVDVSESFYITNNSLLSNIDGLSSLTSVGEDYYSNLVISNNPSLMNINGLSHIGGLPGSLQINNNDALTNVDGLYNINYIGVVLSIHDNDVLANVDGLSELSSVGQSIGIYNNDALTNLGGLYKLTSVEGGLYIHDNEVLLNVNGLNNLSSVGGDLSIYNNTLLTDLDGISAVSSIGGYLLIANNEVLQDVDGLLNISSVGEYLKISDNATLMNLDGLSFLTTVNEYLEISNNASLVEFCGLYPLLSGGGLAGSYTVTDNAENPTQQQIIDGGKCLSLFCPENVYLYSQEDVNNFTCISVEKNLLISGADITDLSPLSNLNSVWRNLTISDNTLLTNLNALSNLTYVGGDLIIENNPLLEEFCGLYPFLFNGYLDGFYTVDGNAENPTEQQIIDGGYCTKICPCSITLLSQEDVNTFYCTSVGGDLTIGGYGQYVDITDLNPLSGLTSLNGSLSIIGADNLTNVNGFSNLDTLGGGSLWITNNEMLTNLDGFSNLKSIDHYLFIADNPLLANLNGLSNLNSVRDIYISRNESLMNLDGLTSINSVDVDLSIGNNRSLQNVDGLLNLSSVGRNFEITGNTSLLNLDSLFSLTSVGGNLTISNNSLITDLDGLSNITSIAGNLQIKNNYSLTEFCGLYPLLNSDGLAGTYTVTGNAINPTKQQIIDAGTCLTESPQPTVYWPLNEGTGSYTEDITVHTNDGTLINYPSWLPGKYGFSLDFDGENDRVECGNGSDLDMGTSDFSFSMWIKMGPEQNRYPTLIAKGAGASYDAGYWIDIVNNKIQFYLSDGTTRLLKVSDPVGIFDNDWHHIAITVNRDENVNFFVDGNNVGTKDISSMNGQNIVSDRALTIGSWQTSNRTNFRGSIDDIRLYNFTLNPEEVSDIADWNLPVNHPPVMVAKATTLTNPVVLPASGDLKVEVVDPDGDELTYEWWRDSGPGNINFIPNNNSVSDLTSATFSEEGNYTIGIQVTDGEYVCTDYIEVVVLPAGSIPNPVAYWTFDRGFGTIAEDVTVNNNDGTLIYEPAWTDGVSVKAISFDGTDDRIDCGTGAELDIGTSDFSFSAWVNMSSDQNKYPTLVAKGAGAAYDAGYWIDIVNNKIQFYLSDGTTRLLKVSDPVSIFDNNWYHIAITVDRGQNVNFYVDGYNVGTKDISAMDGDDIISSKPFTIGSWMTNPNTCFAGILDDVRLYNEALTPDQVSILYNLYDDLKMAPAFKPVVEEKQIILNAYPNPFSGTVTIDFTLEDENEVFASIYNLNGELIKQLWNSKLSAGRHMINWDGNTENGNHVPPGIYAVKVTSGRFVAMKKLIRLH